MDITIMWLQEYGSEMEDIIEFAKRFGKKASINDVVSWLEAMGKEELESWLLSRDVNVTREMLEHGANIHANKDHALLLGVLEGNLEMTKLLLENGADPCARGGLALFMAAGEGCLEMVKVLVEYGADAYGEIIPIIMARDNKHEEIADFLIDNGIKKAAEK